MARLRTPPMAARSALVIVGRWGTAVFYEGARPDRPTTATRATSPPIELGSIVPILAIPASEGEEGPIPDRPARNDGDRTRVDGRTSGARRVRSDRGATFRRTPARRDPK